MLKDLLKRPLMLRRLVKSNERIAKALEDIRDVYFIESGRSPASSEGIDPEAASGEDSDLLSYSTDAATFNTLYGPASLRTLQRYSTLQEEDDGS